MLLHKQVVYYLKTVFSLGLLVQVQSGFSQNLIPNPSFEEYFSCPDDADEIAFSKYWFNPSSASPDYYHECAKANELKTPHNTFGHQLPRTGKAYAGIANFSEKYFTYREYIGTRLLKPLQAGKIYQVSIYVSLADSSQYYNPRFGFCLSREKKLSQESQTNSYDVLICDNGITVCNDSIKKDTTSWHLIKGEYAAQGGEEYLIIGLCKNDFSKKEYRRVKRRCQTYVKNRPYAYYYIDDVAVEEKK